MLLIEIFLKEDIYHLDLSIFSYIYLRLHQIIICTNRNNKHKHSWSIIIYLNIMHRNNTLLILPCLSILTLLMTCQFVVFDQLCGLGWFPFVPCFEKGWLLCYHRLRTGHRSYHFCWYELCLLQDHQTPPHLLQFLCK